MTNEEFKKMLWTAADKLRGSVSAAEPDAKGVIGAYALILIRWSSSPRHRPWPALSLLFVSTGETDSR